MVEVLRMFFRLEVLEYGVFGKVSIFESMFFLNFIRYCEFFEVVLFINFVLMDFVVDVVLMNVLVDNCCCLKCINFCELDFILLDLV